MNRVPPVRPVRGGEEMAYGMLVRSSGSTVQVDVVVADGFGDPLPPHGAVGYAHGGPATAGTMGAGNGRPFSCTVLTCESPSGAFRVEQEIVARTVPTTTMPEPIRDRVIDADRTSHCEPLSYFEKLCDSGIDHDIVSAPSARPEHLTPASGRLVIDANGAKSGAAGGGYGRRVTSADDGRQSVRSVGMPARSPHPASDRDAGKHRLGRHSPSRLRGAAALQSGVTAAEGRVGPGSGTAGPHRNAAPMARRRAHPRASRTSMARPAFAITVGGAWTGR